MAIHKGIRIHHYLDESQIGESQIQPSLTWAYPGTSKNVSGTRMAGEFG